MPVPSLGTWTLRPAWPLLPVLALALSVARAAAADPPPPDQVTPPDDPAEKKQIDRTWLYVDDARIPAPLHVIASLDVSYTNTGSPSRIGGTTIDTYNSFAMNTAQPGAMFGLSGEIGLFSHVSLMAVVDVTAGGEGPSPSAGIVTGLRVQAFPSRWKNTHLVASAGYLREAWQGPIFDDDNPACENAKSPGASCWSSPKPYGDSGAWLQLAFSQDIQRVRLAMTAHMEHVFAAGRDPVDLMVEAGASCRIVGSFRLGAEYVGQDLEESFDPGAEGGARHFVGPVASLQLLRDRLSIVAGPSFGLSRLSPEVLGRAAVALGF